MTMSDRTFAMDEDVVTLIEEARRFDTAPAGYASRLQGAHDLIDRLAAALASRPTPPEDVAASEDDFARAMTAAINDERGTEAGWTLTPRGNERMVRICARVAALAARSLPETEEWTAEPDVTWPVDLRADSRVRASLALIREANNVRDLDGTGIVGRLADMLAGWLPTPEGSET